MVKMVRYAHASGGGSATMGNRTAFGREHSTQVAHLREFAKTSWELLGFSLPSDIIMDTTTSRANLSRKGKIA
jgi:hypothetical protein